MAFQSDNIAKIIPRLNKEYFLPGIQRGYVWEEDQVIELFDSIMRDYPVGAFFFWDVYGDFARNLIKYKFVKDYVTDSVHPNSFHNRNHYNEKVDAEYDEVTDRINLVLDGQQRLTALHIGLVGSITDKRPNRDRKREDTWYRKKLYLNLFYERTNTTEQGLRYQFEFRTPPSDIGPDDYWLVFQDGDPPTPLLWYEVGEVLELDSHRDISKVVDEIGQQLGGSDTIRDPEIALHKETARSVLEELYRAVFKNEIVNYHQELDSNHSRIHEIFLRLNSSGTDLSNEDELLSMLMAAWAYEEDDPVDARKEVNELLTRLNERYDGEFTLNLSFVLRSLLAVASAPMKFDGDEFDQDEFLNMKSVWEDDKFEKSIHKAIDVILSLGLDGTSVRSNNMLIPITYYFHRNWPVSAEWDNNIGQANLKSILYFVATVSINAVYSMKSVTTLRAIMDAIDQDDEDTFPVVEIHRHLLERNQSLALDRERLEEFLRNISYSKTSGKGKARLILSLINYPKVATDTVYHIDHIFPEEMFDKDQLVRSGISREQAEEYRELMHSIGNLQLLPRQENAQKQDIDFDDWLKTRADEHDYLSENVIPENPDLYDIGKFSQFVETRAEMMLDHLVGKFGAVREISQSEP